jgi:hypothetical protein
VCIKFSNEKALISHADNTMNEKFFMLLHTPKPTHRCFKRPQYRKTLIGSRSKISAYLEDAMRAPRKKNQPHQNKTWGKK